MNFQEPLSTSSDELSSKEGAFTTFALILLRRDVVLREAFQLDLFETIGPGWFRYDTTKQIPDTCRAPIASHDAAETKQIKQINRINRIT